ELHLHRPRRRHGDVLRPSVVVRGLDRGTGRAGRGDRLRRLHGALLRPAPAFRGPDQREPGRSARLPLAVSASARSAFITCNPYSAGIEDRVAPRTDHRLPTTPAVSPGAVGAF